MSQDKVSGMVTPDPEPEQTSSNPPSPPQDTPKAIEEILDTATMDELEIPKWWRDEALTSLNNLILKERKAELERLPKPDRTLTTTAYGLKVDYEINNRIAELSKELNKKEVE